MAGLGEQVRAGRTAQGWSQKQLGDALGLAQAQISNLENNKLTPSADVLQKLQKLFTIDATVENADTATTMPAAPDAPAKRGRKPKAATSTANVDEPLTLPPGAKLTLDQLERHLWKAADILRGSIDSGDYKHYIFGLLFYKRLCDVWAEEYEARLAEFGDATLAADPEEHRFDMPKQHSWTEVRKKSHNIGDALNLAFHAIEDANPRLRGVFQDVDFNNKERFPDVMLEKLLTHFEAYSLKKADVEPDMLGNAYEYLIAKFADDAGKKGGEFYTPKSVVTLIVECLRPEENRSVYDPACGSGGMLLEAMHWMERSGKSPNTLTLYGQEKNLNTWAIANMNMFLHDIEDTFIARGDTLLDPKHRVGDSKQLQTFDFVLANPPFSLSPWGHDVWSKGDPYGRDRFGCPPASYGDLAFVQHMVASLSERGRMGVVLPHGVLFRGGSEGVIRKGLLEADLVEGVIGLGPNLFYGTGIPAAVLLLNKKKVPERRGKAVLINGVEQVVEGKAQNTLSAANVHTLQAAFQAFVDVDKLAKVVTLEELASNDFNLNLTRYVQTSAAEAAVDVGQEVAKLQDLMARRSEAEAKLQGFLKELGYAS